MDKVDIGDIGDTGEIENVGDVRNIRHIENKEVSKSNNGVADEKNQDYRTVDKAGDGGDREASKVGYDEVNDGVSVNRDLENLNVSNNSINNSRNKDNWHVIVEDGIDFDDKFTAVVDPTNGVLADILAYSFGPLLP